MHISHNFHICKTCYIDECASNTCVNDGVCVDGFDIFTCTRAVGFMGATCDVAKIILFQFTN